MLPDKNELNNEMIEQINGGLGDRLKGDGDEDDDETPLTYLNQLRICSNCGSKYQAITQRTDGFCPNCEPKPIPKIAPVGDIKTTVPDRPKKNKLIKIH